jgi:tetratricopeptide (TPR) repeat protein
MALLREKLPFFLLALLACFVTFEVQKASGAMSMKNLTLTERVANALNSYVGYLGKIFWPVNLAVPYPYPDHLPAARVIAAAVFLATVTCAVLLLARSRPHLAVGWFWFVVMLVPVIGLVQVGEQGMADRYTYLPSLGVAIMVAWEVPRWLGGWRHARTALAIAAGLALAGCLAVTSRQLPYWHDSVALFSHTIAVTGNHAEAHGNLGEALIVWGKPDAALVHLNEALRLRPGYPQALNNKALLLSQRGQGDAAIALLQQALAEVPYWSDARRNLGQILLDQGRYV